MTSDPNDRASEEEAAARAEAIRKAAKPIEPGKPGDCDYCGEWSGRLIDGACCPCADKYRLWQR